MIKEGQVVILEDNRGDLRLATVEPAKRITWRKTNFPLGQLVGEQFGAVFEVTEGVLKKVGPQLFYTRIDESHVDQTAKDNRNIFANDHAQQLQQQDIQDLKRNKQGQQLIDLIVRSNAKFEERSAFSKEKYLRRKRQKYLFYFTCREITPFSLSCFYFKVEPKKIAFMRPDSLGLALYHTSAKPGDRLLLIDKAGFLVAASLAKNGAGKISVNVLTDPKSLSKSSIVQEMNLTALERESLSAISLDKAKQTKFTQIIIVGEFDFGSVVEQFVDNLERGGILVAFSQYCELLGECFSAMQKERRFINVQMMDVWQREMQVLANRTHPLMSMDKFSGYTLWGVRSQGLRKSKDDAE